jgi:hypothetical protein
MPIHGRPSEHLTRQQLDELDALMQRMLALPVNQLEEETAVPLQPSAPAQRQPTPHADSIPSDKNAALIAGSTSEKPPESVPVVSRRSEPDVQEEQPLPPSLTAEKPGESTKPAVPTVARKSTNLTREPRESFTSPLPRSSASTTVTLRRPVAPWWLLPLAWLNQLFDLATYLLGPFGRLLRSSPGRTLLGLSGVLLLLAAAAWLAVLQMDWTW